MVHHLPNSPPPTPRARIAFSILKIKENDKKIKK
jgi:hypothetical protein